MLQLVQLALAAANPAGAVRLAQTLRADYPGSPLRPHAAVWGARAAFAAGDARLACAMLDSARAEETTVEFVNQLNVHAARCSEGAAAAAARDSAAAPARDPAPASAAIPAPARPVRYDVQAAAAGSQADAQRVVERLRRSGIDARIVEGADGFHRVRVGPFDSVQEATRARSRVRSALGGQPFIVRYDG